MRGYVQFNKYTHTQVSLREDQCEWHRTTRMTGPDCAVMCNLKIHTHTHTFFTKHAEEITSCTGRLQLHFGTVNTSQRWAMRCSQVLVVHGLTGFCASAPLVDVTSCASGVLPETAVFPDELMHSRHVIPGLLPVYYM